MIGEIIVLIGAFLVIVLLAELTFSVPLSTLVKSIIEKNKKNEKKINKTLNKQKK